MIPSKTLDHWGIKKHPFPDQPLDETTMKLFVGREDTLEDVVDAIHHSRVIGIHGTLGSGKSTFLRRFKKELSDHAHPSGYVHLTADSEETLYRELLTELLGLIHRDQVKLKRSPKIDAKRELLRLNASVSDSRGANFGAKIAGILGGDLKEERTKSFAPHDESSARGVIQDIFKALNCPLVVILDDFEKLRYKTSSETRDYFPILNRFIVTLDEFFCRPDLVFVVSMDDQVSGHIEATRKRKGKFAFSHNQLIEVPHLTIQEVIKLMTVRLKEVRWGGTVGKFLTEDAFWGLVVAGGRNPRTGIQILAHAMKHAARCGEEKRISLADLRKAVSDSNVVLDEKHLVIAQHLALHLSTSAYDDALREAAGYAKPAGKHKTNRQFERKLAEAHDLLGLRLVKEPTGQTTKNVYHLDPVLWE